MSATIDPDIEGLSRRRKELVSRLPKARDGIAWCLDHTAVVDDAVRRVYERVRASHTSMPPISVVATGGYGRGEMAPYSDVDITVIPQDEAVQGLDSAVRDIFNELHRTVGSGLGLEVSYAFRLVNDAPALDEKTRSGLLDARLVVGDPGPFQALQSKFWETFPAGEFLLAKIHEREENHRKYNDTPLAVEPHLKEGAGGLRSFQCANWIRAATSERPMAPTKAYSQILRLRNLLHFVAEKRVDLLTR